MALHDAALKDDYFVSRKLAPNVDFWRYVQASEIKPSSDDFEYSGLIYRAMGAYLYGIHNMGVGSSNPGFPMDFFPVLFVVPRVVGWLAHWRQVLAFLLYSERC